MADNIIDFEKQRHSHVHKRKEARIDALRQAFRLARNDKAGGPPSGKRKRPRKPRQ